MAQHAAPQSGLRDLLLLDASRALLPSLEQAGNLLLVELEERRRFGHAPIGGRALAQDVERLPRGAPQIRGQPYSAPLP